MTSSCSHFDRLAAVAPDSDVCVACVAAGDTWVHLRVCLTCGHVGCCDDSKNRHATQHYGSTGHPVMRSMEPGETWGWCYVHQKLRSRV